MNWYHPPFSALVLPSVQAFLGTSTLCRSSSSLQFSIDFVINLARGWKYSKAIEIICLSFTLVAEQSSSILFLISFGSQVLLNKVALVTIDFVLERWLQKPGLNNTVGLHTVIVPRCPHQIQTPRKMAPN